MVWACSLEGCVGAPVICWNCAWCSVCIGDSLWRFREGQAVLSSSIHGSCGDVGTGERRDGIVCVYRFLFVPSPGIPFYCLGFWSFLFAQGCDSLEMACL